MARSFGYSLRVFLLLTLVLFAFVSSENEPQPQQQQQFGPSVGAVVTELPTTQSNRTTIPPRVIPTSRVSSSEESGDSPEEDEGGEIEEEEDDGGGDEEGEEEEEDEVGEEDEEDEDEVDEASLADDEPDDEYEDELRAVVPNKPTTDKTDAAETTAKLSRQEGEGSIDKEVSELLEFKRRKKTTTLENESAAKDKRVPTVKKELSSQKEILIADNETQIRLSHPVHVEVLDHIDKLPKEFMKNELQEMENYEEGTYNEPQQQQQSPAVAAAASQSELSFENAYTVLRPGEILKKLSKRQGALLKDLKTYLLDEYMAEREKLQELGSEEGLVAENLLKLREKLAKLVENPQRWERVHQLLSNIKNDLYYSRQSVDAQKRLVQVSNPYMRESMSTLTTPMPSSASSNRPTRKPKKKKKKKKKPRHWVNSSTTSAAITTTTEVTSTPQPPAVLALATSETPWPTTRTPGAMTWRLFAEKLFRPTWNQEELGVDDSNVAKLRYSIPSKPRSHIASMRRPLDDKERESLKALNSERRALMLKAAREYSQPRLLHFGKINTHQQTSSDEDLEDGFDSNQRSYQRTHFGQLVSPSSTRLGSGFPRPREHPLSYPEQQQQLQQSPPQFDVDFARNQEYLPPGREFAASKPWQGGGSSFHYDNPWSKLGETKGPAPISSSESSWNWRQFSNPPVPAVPKPWLPWHTERDYFARLEEKEEETTKAWKQAQQRQQQRNWNRQNMREMVPPWQEEKDVRRVHQTPESWLKPEKSRKYGLQRDQHSASWDNSRNNNSELKHTGQSQSEDDSKESPKLTMKTWNSLTSDPATWPFQLPGAKPWPKDANGKSYNPNAELVRKLGLYKNGRLKPEKDALIDLKQQKLQKTEKQGELVQPDDTRPIPWGGKVAPIPSKINTWIEPDEQQTWYNNMKLHKNYEDVDSSPNDRSNHWSNEGQSSQSNNARMWSREKLPDEWNLEKAATSSNTWPAKWKQFAYHKVTAQPTSKSGVTLDKPNKNAYIAVSAVSSPRYGNEWRKNDLEDIGPLSNSGPITEDPDHPASQLRMSVWKKSSGVNETMNAIDKAARIDVLENQLEDLKKNEGPVLLEVNVTIRNSTSNQTLTSAPSTLLTVNGSPKDIENKNKEKMTSKKNQQTSN